MLRWTSSPNPSLLGGTCFSFNFKLLGCPINLGFLMNFFKEMILQTVQPFTVTLGVTHFLHPKQNLEFPCSLVINLPKKLRTSTYNQQTGHSSISTRSSIYTSRQIVYYRNLLPGLLLKESETTFFYLRSQCFPYWMAAGQNNKIFFFEKSKSPNKQ